MDDIVKNAFNLVPQSNIPNTLYEKLNYVKKIVKFWNKHDLGKLENQIDYLNDQIVQMEIKDMEGQLSSSSYSTLTCLYNRQAALLRQLETKWHSKCRDR